MRPVLEKIDNDEATEIVREIIRRKGETDMTKLEESFRRSVESCHQSVGRVLRTAVNRLKKSGKVKQKKSKLLYKSQKA